MGLWILRETVKLDLGNVQSQVWHLKTADGWFYHSNKYPFVFERMKYGTVQTEQACLFDVSFVWALTCIILYVIFLGTISLILYIWYCI